MSQSIRIKKRSFRSDGRKRFKSLLIRFILFIILISILSGAGLYYYMTRDLPPVDSISDYRPNIITKVYSDEGIQIGEFAIERRELIPISKVPALLIQSFVSAEDDRFFEHEGLDFFSIFRAFIKNLKAGGVVQGGSTITQQVAKSLLTSERTYTRKFKEAVLAYRIEKNFSKNEILYLYLNQIYLGHGAYGVQAAAQSYFHKNVDELTIAEMAILAGLPQAPSKYSPATNPDKARERQHYVLRRMVDEGYINIVESTDAMNTPIEVFPIRDINTEMTPYYTEHIRRYLERRYGADSLYKDGLIVQTTVNVDMQKKAQAALKKGVSALDRRQGYRGALRRIEEPEMAGVIEELQKKLEKTPIKEGEIYEGVVVEVNSEQRYTEVMLGEKTTGRIPLKGIRWARKPDPEVASFEVAVKDPAEVFNLGDLIQVKVKGSLKKGDMLDLSLYQEPLVQAATMAIDPKNGYVKAMVGGFDFAKSKFNRAVQSRRQPGSAFKPILYSAALDNGYTPASIIMDSPIIYKGDEDDFTWKPKNYEDKFYGPTTLRTALTKSRNVVTIKIMQTLGIDYVIDYARRMGITSHLSRDFSIALGSSGLSLKEIVSAYGIFAASGIHNKPVFITKIMDREGNVLEEHIPQVLLDVPEPVAEEVPGPAETAQAGEDEEDDTPPGLRNIPPGHAISSQTAYLMSSILKNVVEHGTGWRAKALKRPVGGKTGTTNDLFDAWFIGFTPDLVAGTWVGFDQEAPLGKYETGSGAAAPIFVDFMQQVYEGKPVEDFPIPPEITFSRIDTKTGLLAPPSQQEDVFFECFKEGTQPTRFATEVAPEPGDFFRQGL